MKIVISSHISGILIIFSSEGSLYLRAETGDFALAAALNRDWRMAPVDEPTLALLAFAEKMTLASASMTGQDVRHLRGHGFSDEAILCAGHVAGFFSHINRVADSLGVDLEDFMTR